MSEQSREKIIELIEQDLTPAEMENQIFDLLLASLGPIVAEALSRCALPHWFDKAIICNGQQHSEH